MNLRLNILTALIVFGAASAQAQTSSNFIELSSCSQMEDVRYLDRARLNPEFVRDCIQRGSPFPSHWKTRNGIRSGSASPIIFNNTKAPQDPPARELSRAGIAGAGSGFDLFGFIRGLIQDPPIPSNPNLPPVNEEGGSGSGGSGGGASGGGNGADETHRCQVRGNTIDITSTGGTYELPCGGGVELSTTPFTIDSNAQLIGHVKANRSEMEIYRRRGGGTDTSSFTLQETITFPSHYCVSGNPSTAVSLPPEEQFFTIGDNTRFLAIQLQPDSNIDAEGTSNYNYVNEFILLRRSGRSFSTDGRNCGNRDTILSGAPSDLGSFIVRPSTVTECDVRQLPLSGICEPDVMWLNIDDSSFLYQPNASVTLHSVGELNTVWVESAANTVFYLRDNSTIHVPWGTGQQNFADGANIILNEDFYVYVPPPGAFEIRANGQLFLPNGGQLYNSNDELQQEYAANTGVAPLRNFAYEVNPLGAIALPAGMMAPAKINGTIRLPEDR